MEAITVRDLLTAVGGTLIGPETSLDRTVSSVDTDSRDIHPGSLFLPLVGERFDGHTYIGSALEAGAAGCLTAREPEHYQEGRFYIKVEDTQRALRDLAFWYKEQFRIPFVGVTGSVGKTTAKDMIASVLSAKYKVLKTEGNFNNNVGLPLTLLRLDRSVQIGVVEMGMDRFGEIDYLGDIVRPEVGVITNIGDAHIERLGSRENIFRAKCELLPHIRKENGLLILNGDDALLSTLRGRTPVPAVFCGSGEGLEYRAQSASSEGLDSLRSRLTTPAMDREVCIPALGSHMIYPTLIAAAVGEHFGLTADEIEQGIARFVPTRMRMNILYRGDGIVILDDTYNANPQSMRAAAAVLGDAKDRRRVAVVGDMKELGANSAMFHQAVGGYFAQAGVERLIAIGDLAKHMAQGAVQAGMSQEQVSYFHDLEEAKEALSREIRAGVTILVKASRSMAFEKIVDYLTAQTQK